MDLANKLKIRFEKELNIEIEENPTIKRTYAGRHQRSVGAWSWYLRLKNNSGFVGSCEPAKEILKANYLTSRDHFSDIEVSSLEEPEQENKKTFGYTWVRK
jgi:hypothetical protein